MLLLLLASLLGTRLAERAEAAAGLRSVRELSRTATDDCSGFVRTIYGREGVNLMVLPPRPGENGVSHLHRIASARRALRRRPEPGDLVFFRDTYRRGLSHVGSVERVRGSEVSFVHRAGSGIVRSRLDLHHPHARKRNDVLRRAPRRALTGELLVGFAAPDPLPRHSTNGA
jgi:cell wall-associated NlpC family hydrolase